MKTSDFVEPQQPFHPANSVQNDYSARLDSSFTNGSGEVSEIMEQAEFPGLNGNIEYALLTAVPLVTSAGGVTQILLFDRQKQDSLSVRWFAIGKDYEVHPLAVPYVEQHKPIPRSSDKPGIFWDVLDCITGAKAAPSWLREKKLGDFFPELTTGGGAFYVADTTHPEIQDKRLPLTRRRVDRTEVMHRSSVVIPISIHSRHLPGGAESRLVGLLSFDSGLGPELIERMPHELLHLEALAGWLGRTLEMLDANSYDSLTGDYGIYSSRHYAWKLAGLHNRESLRLVYCGLNGSEGLGSSSNSEERDEVIRDFGRRLSDYCKSSKAFDEFWIFRFKEDEFGILFHLFPDNADELDLRAWLKETFVSSGPLSVRLGGTMQFNPAVGVAAAPRDPSMDSNPPGAPPFRLATRLRTMAFEAMEASKKVYRELNNTRSVVFYDTSAQAIQAIKEKCELRTLLRESLSPDSA